MIPRPSHPGRGFFLDSPPEGGAMERKEDVILECFVLKGKGLDWLAVIYLEGGNRLKAILRIKLSEKVFQISPLTGQSQKKISEEIHTRFDQVSKTLDLSVVHFEYPGGLKEGDFIRDLREAKAERKRILEIQKN